MRYGEIQYSDILQLSAPNVIIGRSDKGDWVEKFDAPTVTFSENETVLEGNDAIAEYAESAFERYEDNQDLQAGLVAVQIMHNYAKQHGDTTPAVRDEMVAALMAEKHPNSYMYILALDAHPAIAASIRDIMAARSIEHTTMEAVADDQHLMAYLEAEPGSDDLQGSLDLLAELRRA